jgi:predicted ester cyclase
MKRLGVVFAIVIGLAVGFASGFKTALFREHSRLEHNKQIVRRIHKEVWSNPDLNAALKAADELYTPDFVVHDSIGDSYGLASRKKDIAENLAAYPDNNEEVLDAVAEGDMVVTRFISTGTHKGDLPAIPGYQPRIPANGKFIRVPELAVHRLVNGRLAEQWELQDNWAAYIQEGVIDPDK